MSSISNLSSKTMSEYHFQMLYFSHFNYHNDSVL